MNQEGKNVIDRRRHGMGAILWALAAVLSLVGVFQSERTNPLMILVTLAFAVSAGVFLVKYIKDRQEGKNHD